MATVLSIIRSVLRQLFMLAAFLLVLLAVYVSLGRQLLPLVSNYQSEIEQALAEQLGVPVTVGTAAGSWNRINPGLSLGDVQLRLPEQETRSPLLVEQLEVEVDVLSSLRQWRLILSRVTVRDAEFTLQQSPQGNWQLAGLGAIGSGGFDANRLLMLASRFKDLSFSGMRLNLVAADGSRLSLEQGNASLQTLANRYVLQLNARLPEQPELLRLSADFKTDATATPAGTDPQLDGEFYLHLPEADFSTLASLLRFNDWQGRRMTGSAELWFILNDNQLMRAHGRLAMPELVLAGASSELSLSGIQGVVDARRTQGDQGWDLVLQDAGFSWQGNQWPATDMSLQMRGETGLALQMQSLDVGMLGGLAGELDLLPEAALTTLSEFSPRGRLHALVLELEGQQPVRAAHLRAEMDEISLAERKGSPALWGLNGYAELDYSADDRMASGQFEVDSETVMMHLPRLFISPWQYDRVNGRVKFRADLTEGVQLRLASSVIVAESEVIDGRAQFAVDFSRSPEGEVSSGLELMVGTLSADIAQKALYLPMAPDAPQSIQGAMEWVNSAVLAGDGSRSGIIYRGSTIPGSAPEEKTLQMFYRVQSGVLKFHPEWPELEKLDGLVVINDSRVDVLVDHGESLGIGFGATQASVRPNPEGPGSWLSVSGSGQGSADAGLLYLQQTPVTSGFGSYLSDWQTSGDLGLTLELRIPLYMEESRPQVNLQVGLQDNSLSIPDYDLDFSHINGTLQYAEGSGLISQDMTAELFGETAAISLRSDGMDAEDAATTVNLDSAADIDNFAEWGMHTPLALALLERVDGRMQYQATFSLPHQAPAGDEAVASRFSLRSTLDEVSIDLPRPLVKPSGSQLPLQLDIGFLNNGKRQVRTSLGNIVLAEVRLTESATVERGLVTLGARTQGLPVRRYDSNAPGLEILGTLDTFDYDRWSAVVLAMLQDSTGSVVPGREFPVAADVMIADARFLGQEVADLGLQISSGPENWALELDSATVAGNILLPVDTEDYIIARLSRLHLPGTDEDEPPATDQEGKQQTPDPLADIDPREFPRLQFSTDELKIGEADYGQWQFTLDPVPEGVVLTDLEIVSRGLEIGTQGNFAEFTWDYDGAGHRSRFLGHVTADNLATVLSSFGYAPSLESSNAVFNTDVSWDGSPAAFSVMDLQGAVDLQVNEGRFLQGSGAGNGALKLISIINFDALIRRLRFSDDLVRSGLAYEEIRGALLLDKGEVEIVDRLHIIGPSSLFQIMGLIDIRNETIDGSMYITLPVSDNIPWLGGLAALNNLINWQVAIGVFLFDRIFGDQVDDLTSAQYLLKGPWEGLEPELNQVFTAGGESANGQPAPTVQLPEPASSPTTN